jgi:murein DD-endopeptidase MepM/ murein hydrolase activator NlpD
VPPRRSRGRHRRPKNTAGPAYVTAATLAAFTVSGMNVPGAIGDARQATSSTPAASAATSAEARSTFAAVQLRNTLAAQQEERASRLRSAQAEAVAAYRKAARQARIAAAKARPKWVLPVSGFRLTAGFGQYGLWSHAHTGQDFACAYGTPVHAVGDGKIVFAGYDGAYGNKIAIEHPDGTVTWYAHMSAFVRTSGAVKAGDVIGRVGMTGNTTGAHLHLEVRPHDGPPVPPLTWLRAHRIKI